jgi:hypothetical protein
MRAVWIFFVSFISLTNLSAEWRIEPSTQANCKHPKGQIKKQLSALVEAYLEEKGLPTNEGNLLLPRQDDTLRFDNQGPSNEYRFHDRYQIQYGKGLKNGGCHASVIIQEGAPLEQVKEIFVTALSDPNHTYRLYNTSRPLQTTASIRKDPLAPHDITNKTSTHGNGHTHHTNKILRKKTTQNQHKTKKSANTLDENSSLENAAPPSRKASYSKQADF